MKNSTWSAYIAGMIEAYLKTEPPAESREAAIAGIIERRMWSKPTPRISELRAKLPHVEYRAETVIDGATTVHALLPCINGLAAWVPIADLGKPEPSDEMFGGFDRETLAQLILAALAGESEPRRYWATDAKGRKIESAPLPPVPITGTQYKCRHCGAEIQRSTANPWQWRDDKRSIYCNAEESGQKHEPN